jgi:antitoxin ParD1/3/4
MEIQIPADLTDFVGSLVSEGRFESENQVLAEGLRLLRVREQLRRDVEAGIAQLDRGEGLDEDAVFEELEREIDAIERQRAV